MAEQKRKLAAIVFTDIVGFTKLTAKDQTLASSLLEKQRNLLKPIVEDHGGKWIKEMGDGLLLIFDTVPDAVECCIQIQEVTKPIDELVLRIILFISIFFLLLFISFGTAFNFFFRSLWYWNNLSLGRTPLCPCSRNF